MKKLHIVLAAALALTACGESITEPPISEDALETTIPSGAAHTAFPEVIFLSGVTVRTWNPITPPTQPGDWPTSICTSIPLFGPNDPAWTGEHNSFVLSGHPWTNDFFLAPWINSWNNLASSGSGSPAPSHNWTKYQTPVFGSGDYVVQLLADNCSWIYIDGALLGVQDTDLTKNTYPVELDGTHTLTFVIFDGGGAAGGKFRLESSTSYVANGGDPGDIQPALVDTDDDGAPDVLDAFPTDPTETTDSDGDGRGNNSDAFPNDPNEQDDSDGDGVGDNADAFPNDPLETVDTDGDGHGDNGDVFPNDPLEWADSDGDGVGDNADAFPNDPLETVDTDGDGHGDNGDVFPNDPLEWADSDGDGVGDNADAFPNDPSETVDTDGDGHGDNGDVFPNSILDATVAIGGCDSGVANQLMPNGATFADMIAEAQASARNHGAFVRSVSQMANDWKKDGLISGRDKGAITSCAARSK